jgi:hypothetical protein
LRCSNKALKHRKFAYHFHFFCLLIVYLYQETSGQTEFENAYGWAAENQTKKAVQHLRRLVKGYSYSCENKLKDGTYRDRATERKEYYKSDADYHPMKNQRSNNFSKTETITQKKRRTLYDEHTSRVILGENNKQIEKENALVVSSVDSPLPESSPGFVMLKRMGWSQGGPLGKAEQAETALREPIKALKPLGKQGVGFSSIK